MKILIFIKENKIFFLMVSLLAIFAGGTIFIFLGMVVPVFSETEKIEKEIAQARFSQLEVSTFKPESVKIEEAARVAKNMLVDKDLPLSFIEFLEETAPLCRVKINIFSSKASQEKDFFPFEVEAEGSFKGIMCFVERVETGRFAARIASFNASSGFDGKAFCRIGIRAFAK